MAVHSWRSFAVVFGHSFDSKCFAAERVGKQALPYFDLQTLSFSVGSAVNQRDTLKHGDTSPKGGNVRRKPLYRPLNNSIGVCYNKLTRYCYLQVQQ